MKVYVIKSQNSETPLAEVRTDGNAVDFVVDNTEGMLPQQVAGSFTRLQAIVRTSHHLSMEEPKEATANLIRYVMNNGDVIEITTDGRTCMLNGKLIDDKAKNALFQAIRRGDLQVARKADEPVPVIPTPAPAMKQPETPEVGHRSKEVISMLADMRDRQRDLEENYTQIDDPSIDDKDYAYSDDPEFSKNLARRAKYGK